MEIARSFLKCVSNPRMDRRKVFVPRDPTRHVRHPVLRIPSGACPPLLDRVRIEKLHPNRNDLPPIRQALLRQCELDKRKLDMLLVCGLELADREDGTSSYLRSAIVHLDFRRAILLAKAGAWVPKLRGGDVHFFNSALYYRRKIFPGELSEKEFDFLQELIASRP